MHRIVQQEFSPNNQSIIRRKQQERAAVLKFMELNLEKSKGEVLEEEQCHLREEKLISNSHS